MKYRLYIDEVGNPDLKASSDPNHRYLSLTGLILELNYVATIAFPALERLKHEYFRSHPDNPVILHRKEIVNKKPPFHSLRDPSLEKTFSEAILRLLRELDYRVITVVIDKLEHRRKYKVWRFHPYHYCLMTIVERYALWLRRAGATGDVMIEARGKKEDQKLKDSFRGFFETGTEWLPADAFETYLTSRELKIRQKEDNISGLQLADLIAHPSFRATLNRKKKAKLPDNFGGRIAQILEESKYYRSPTGTIDGWGRKWLP